MWRANASSVDELKSVFDLYEEYDGDTLERVWQSLFKVYNQTLRKLGDNDFRVEHTGVKARQRAGTLERVVKYDAEALSAAWDYLASSDSEDYIYFFFFFFSIFSPLERGDMRPFFGRWPMHEAAQKKKNGFQLKKWQRFQKYHRQRHRTRLRARVKITDFTLCVGGSTIYDTW